MPASRQRCSSQSPSSEPDLDSAQRSRANSSRAHDLAALQRVFLAGDHDHMVFHDQLMPQAGLACDGHAGEHEIEAAIAQCRHQPRPVPVVMSSVMPGACIRSFAHTVGSRCWAIACPVPMRTCPEAPVRNSFSSRAASSIAARTRVAWRATCSPKPVRVTAFGRAFKESRVELALQPRDALRQRRLGKPQRFGRTPDMAVGGNGQEIAEIAWFHCNSKLWRLTAMNLQEWKRSVNVSAVRHRLATEGDVKQIWAVACALLLLGVCAAATAQSYPTRPVRIVVPLSRRQRHGCARAHRRGEVAGDMGAASHGREPGGGERHCRHRGGGQGRPRRLYADHAVGQPCHQREPVQQAALRHAEGREADRTHRLHTALVLCVNPQFPATNVSELIALAKARPGKLNYGSSGNGSSLAPRRREIQDDDRHRHCARSVQGREPGADRSAGRTDRPHVRRRRGRGGTDPGGQAARAWGDFAEAYSAVSRHADDQRGRRDGLRGAVVAGASPAPRHCLTPSPARSTATSSRCWADPDVRAKLAALALEPALHGAVRIRRVHGGRPGEMEHRRQGDRRAARLAVHGRRAHVKKIYVVVSMDCERPNSETHASASGPPDYATSEVWTRAYAGIAGQYGWPVTFFIHPESAQNQAPLFHEFERAGHCLALHLHPWRYDSQRFPAECGGLTEEALRAALTDATLDWTAAMGKRPLYFRPGAMSGNDAL